MIKNPIFIPYETKTREFDGKLLLISHLLDAGFSKIFFGSRSACKAEALNWKNGIYILKSLAREEEAFYKQLKENGFNLILLHVEGGIHYRDNKNSILSFFNPEMMKYIDLNFVFGETIKEDIKKFIGKEAYNKTIVSGEPRFDLLKGKYRDFFKDEIKIFYDRYRDFILINTSFGLSNPIMGVEKAKTYYENEKTLTDHTRKLIFEKMVFMKNVLVSFIEVAKLLALKYPQINFIIRPHPEEDLATYTNSFVGNKNIIIDRSGNVVPWILASKGVIHYDCTTGMEAALAKKPVLSYMKYENESVTAWLPVALSNKTTNVEDLYSLVYKILNNKFQFKRDQKLLEKWQSFVANVNIFSSTIIVEELTKYLTENKLKAQYSRIYEGSKKEKTKNLILLILPQIIKKTGSQSKFGQLDKKEIKSKMKKLFKINHVSVKFNIKRINKTMVFIKRMDF